MAMTAELWLKPSDPLPLVNPVATVNQHDCETSWRQYEHPCYKRQAVVLGCGPEECDCTSSCQLADCQGDQKRLPRSAERMPGSVPGSGTFLHRTWTRLRRKGCRHLSIVARQGGHQL